MDASQTVVEEVDRFAGLTFGQACTMLFTECKSNAPASESFQATIDFIRGVHESMGVEFSCDDYWNKDTISGSHQVFPENLGREFNVIPDDLTVDYIDEMIDRLGALESLNSRYRAGYERTTAARGSRAQGVIDTRALTRTVNASPVFLKVSDVEEEDDFI